jgi:HAD superfamily hydrolase (TIGR01509 family)
VRRAELVIFDCDGVLVDSEPVGNRVLADALIEVGVPMTLTEVERDFRGLSMASVVRWVEASHGIKLDGGFLSDYQERLFVALRHGIVAMPGARETITRLAVPCCVASSGEPEKMRLTLGLCGLLPALRGRLFSAVEVERGKPAPDLFLHAAARLGMAPDRCVVIEDSVAGISAALAAGMQVYGYAPEAGPNGGHKERLRAAGAKPLVDLRELAELLATFD